MLHICQSNIDDMYGGGLMGDLVCDGTSFSCPFCTSKLKLMVPSSSSKGSSKNLANTSNSLFPPPGGQCTVCPSAPVPCVPSVSVVDPGQKPVLIDGLPALGDGCKFLCAKGGLITVSSSGQTAAKHEEAEDSVWVKVAIGAAIVVGVAAAVLSRGKVKPQDVAKAARSLLRRGASKGKAIGKSGKVSNSVPKKPRDRPPPPDPKAQGRPHTIIEKPGKNGQYTTHNGDGTYKQYRGSGKDHGNIPRPNVKENQLNHSPKGTFPGKPKVRPARPDEIPK